VPTSALSGSTSTTCVVLKTVTVSVLGRPTNSSALAAAGFPLHAVFAFLVSWKDFAFHFEPLAFQA
jgi:hypothetical protein